MYFESNLAEAIYSNGEITMAEVVNNNSQSLEDYVCRRIADGEYYSFNMFIGGLPIDVKWVHKNGNVVSVYFTDDSVYTFTI